MKTQITSITMNTSASFQVSAPEKVTLGWNAMPSFPQNITDEAELGWDAMPAFGQAMSTQGDAELVADLVSASRNLRGTKGNVLNSFWTAICR